MIIDIIEKSLEEREICSIVFLNVAQSFDKVNTMDSTINKANSYLNGSDNYGSVIIQIEVSELSRKTLNLN